MNKYNILFTFVLLVGCIIFFGFTQLDDTIQNLFYNYQKHNWILDRHLQPYKFIFYDGIKKLLILIACILLIGVIFFRNKEIIKSYKQGIYIVLLSAVLVPLSVGILKKVTNMPCPKDCNQYEGKYIETKVWETYPAYFIQQTNTKCWPAGHASGGFALFSLFFLFKSKKNKRIALFGAMSIGWSMGLYKMLIGDHFLSHTIITMILSWLLVSLIAKVVLKFELKSLSVNKIMIK